MLVADLLLRRNRVQCTSMLRTEPPIRSAAASRRLPVLYLDLRQSKVAQELDEVRLLEAARCTNQLP